MRGFFVLFWVGMAVYTIITVYRNWKTQGILISLGFFFQISKDRESLAISDLVMVCSLFTAVIIQKLLVRKWIPMSSALIVQHIWQCLWFSSCIFWVFYKKWGIF